MAIDESPANPEIFKAYTEAGKLADSALKFAISQVNTAGSKVFNVCQAIDAEMANCALMFKAPESHFLVQFLQMT